MKRDRENRDLRNRDRIREDDEVSNQGRREQFVPQPGLSNRDLLPLRDNRDGRVLRNRGREHGRDVRYRYGDSRKCLPDDEHKLRENKYRYRERNKEFEEITEHYSRSKKTRMGVIKPSEKFSFSLDGENTEDTSRGRNSLYQNPREAGLLYGRGFRGERDLLEHKKLPADGPGFTAGRHQKEHKKLAAHDRGFSPGSDGWGRGFSPGRDLWARGFRTGSDQWVHKTLAAEHKISAANTYDTFGMRVDNHWPDKKRDDRHWIHKKLEEMTERDWIIFLEDNDISFQGSKIPRPLRDWADSKLNAQLLKALERRACYHQPTSIQMAAIPPALEQRDVLAIGKPITGKTAAFVLPMLNHVSRLPRISEVNEAEGPYAVVMAPTRVLAQEIEDETIKLAYFSGIKVVSIVGGESMEEQGSGVGRGCEVIIATPSRLLDCLERGYVVLNQCICVVLDAADRMIDMGFEPQVVGVLEAMPNSNLKPENEDAELDEKKIYRSTYMFGCTMTLALEQLAKKYLRNPVVVTVRNPVFTLGPTTENITMIVVMVKESEKGYRLRSLLDEVGDKTAMVFVNTKKNADRVAKSLDKAGYRVTPLHSERKSQEEQREESSEDFRTKRCNVLVSTDFGQRGVDVPDVDLVINYDMPCNIEAYVHRIERTYPALKFGVVTTFLTLNDCDVFYAFKRLLREHGSVVPRELARHEAANIIPDRPPVRWKDAVLAH